MTDGAPLLFSSFLFIIFLLSLLSIKFRTERPVRSNFSLLDRIVTCCFLCWLFWFIVPLRSTAKSLLFMLLRVLVRLVWFLLLVKSTCWEWKERYYVKMDGGYCGSLRSSVLIRLVLYCVLRCTLLYCSLRIESCISYLCEGRYFCFFHLTFVWGPFPRYFVF